MSYDDYGKFQSVWMYANIINIIISFGISAVILSTNLNFFFLFIKKNKKKLSIFYSALWISGLAAFFLFAKSFSPSLKLLVIGFIIVQNITTLSETLLIKRKGEKISFVINFIYSLFFFGWHIYILTSGYSLYHLVEGIIAISIVKWIVIIITPKGNEEYANAYNEKQFLNHWKYLGLNEVLGIISKWIDKVFLLYLLTTTDFAIFFNGCFEIPLFGLLISVMGSFLAIEISGNNLQPDKIKKLFRESFLVLSAIVFPLFFFLFFFRGELFYLAFKDKYNASLPIFVISIFILPLRINNYSVVLQCFSQGKKILLGSVLDILITIILILTLYPIMGTRGIALAAVIATYCQVIFYLWHSSKILHITIFQILPLQKLATRLLLLAGGYVGLFFILAGLKLKMKLLIAALITGLIIMAGLLKYFKTFSQKDHVQNS
ncbi:MAG: polysaccharide biosynthesis C-terminal domain-containing protein [Bacteroidota bacterium]|nr:polysaccharide biosynthesis C-terminal domain-containing protein [Bacteroidota bacterium]